MTWIIGGLLFIYYCTYCIVRSGVDAGPGYDWPERK